MRLRRVLPLLLVAIMLIGMMPMMAFAAGDADSGDTDTVTIDVASAGKYIQIHPDGYIISTSGKGVGDKVPFTGKYILTGMSVGVDTPVEFVNESGNKVTYDVVFKDLTIVSRSYSTAINVVADSPIDLNIANFGETIIEAWNHAAIKRQSSSTADFNINILNCGILQLSATQSGHQAYTGTSCTINGVSIAQTDSVNDNSGHDFTIEDSASKYLVSDGNCTEGAVYYLSCSRCGESSNAVAKTFSLQAPGHDWSEVTYTWSEDNSTCTAERVCNVCDASETSEATVTSSVVTAATYDNVGTTGYTAEFTDDWAETQYVEVDNIDKLIKISETVKAVMTGDMFGVVGVIIVMLISGTIATLAYKKRSK